MVVYIENMNKYEEQAKNFLADTGTTLEIVKAVPQKSPLWASPKNFDHGINYFCTLKNAKHTYGFDYWGSMADAEKIKHGEGHGTKPKAYEILACLNPLNGADFEDFCAEFGYNEDSIMALKTFEAVREQDRNLRKLFSVEQLEALTEIQ